MTKRLLLVSLSVAWVAALLCVTEVLAQAGNCEPVCTTAGKKVEDKYNCTRFYLCLSSTEHSDVPLPCPTGTSFEILTQECTGTLPCFNTCTLPPCPTKCSNDPGTLPDTKNCRLYYFCSDGNIVGPYECPDDKPYFDSSTEACDVSPSVCCSDPCLAYCQVGEVETQDPYDCHKFYYCPYEGPADEIYHSSCPSGENFDVISGTCLPSTSCNSLCEGNPLPGGDTTTKEETNTPTTTPKGGTTIPTTNPTTSATATPDCQDAMTCTSVGLFAKCTITCDQQYFNCHFVGQPATISSCVGGYVFNTDPDYAYCVLPDECPFHPPFRAHLPLF